MCLDSVGPLGYGFRSRLRLIGSEPARGRGSAGRASPCQGEGRGFESRRPLGARLASSGGEQAPTVEWPRGEATACKAVYTGSNPVSTSGDWRSGSALP